MLANRLRIALTCCLAAAGVALHANAQGMAMVVVPYRPYEICLAKESLRRGEDGLTYFNIVACGPNEPRVVEEYRLNCHQSPDGPYALEQKLDGQWITRTAQSFDELGQIVRRICAFPQTLPKTPPRPMP